VWFYGHPGLYFRRRSAYDPGSSPDLDLKWPVSRPNIEFPMIQPEDIQRLIQAGLPGAAVRVSGDGHHFEAEIVAAEFAGKSLVQRHQMVYRTLGDKMKAEIHALSLKTLTPEEAQRAPAAS
jgi:acid stress-induced BolA-like protein IbaG/YrbA